MGNEEDDFFLNISESEQLRFDVFDALKSTSVDPREQRIVWPDGARLSIEDTARRIHAESGGHVEMVQAHVVHWLETGYEPEGLDDQQMEKFERLIGEWIDPYDDLN